MGLRRSLWEGCVAVDFGVGMDLGRSLRFSHLLFSPSLRLLRGCGLARCRQGKVDLVSL